jgi:outer membrane protein assembly factor BamB
MNRTLAMLLLFLSAGWACAGDWPQWLGPARDGKSPEAVAPWKGDLKVVWRQPAGEGHSSPIVAEGRVFIHAKVQDKEQEEVVALDAATGKEIWRKSYDRTPYTNVFGNGPRSTPLVDGERLYTLGVTGILACWNASDGKEHWKIDLLKEFTAKNLTFGVSTSPIIVGDQLLVMVGGPEASIVSLEKATGKVRWKSGSDQASYSSPILTNQANRTLGLFLTQKGLLALDPATGQSQWQFPMVDRLSESSTTPIRSGDMIFVSSVTVGSHGLKLTVKDGKPGFEEVWKNAKLTCYFATPIAVGDHLYVVTGQVFPASAQLHCVESASGKILWSRPNIGKYHATLLLAKDKLLLLEEAGSLVLLDPSPKEYRELARSKVCGQTWAHPALSDGKLYLRDGKELICVSLAEKP